MSLASAYAAACAADTAGRAVTTANQPPSFVGPNGTASVTPSGGIKLTQTASGDFEVPAAAALAFAAWITATFG